MFSTQIIVDADQRTDGMWEVVLRFGPDDMIAAYETDSLVSIESAIGAEIAGAIFAEKGRT